MTWKARLAFAAVLAGSMAVADVSPDQVTVGTEVLIAPPIDVVLGDAKPRLKVRYVGPPAAANKKTETPKLRLKVSESNPANATAIVKQAKGVGQFEIEVTPKLEGAAPFVVGPIETVLPRPETVDPDTAGRKTEVVITGTFFGTKKPKVLIGGKKAKVLEFSDTELRVRTHKKTPFGPAALVVRTTVGDGEIGDAVTIEGGDGGGDGDPVTGEFLRFDSTGALRLHFDGQAVVNGFQDAGRFTVVALNGPSLVAIGFTLEVNVELDDVTANQVIDLDASRGDVIRIATGDPDAPPLESQRTFTIMDPPNGTSATLTVLSFDSITRTLHFELDADLQAEETDQRITIRGGRGRTEVTDRRD